MYLKTGDNAPDFELFNYDNTLIKSSNLKGKKYIIWFFPKANTPGWTIQGCGFRDEFEKFKDLNIDVIGVSADSVSKQDKFVKKYNFPFLMLSDETKEMLKSYKAWGLKKFMGREYEGIHRISYLINEKGVIEKVFDKVKTKSHALDVLSEVG